jgi:hypothetical protein
LDARVSVVVGAPALASQLPAGEVLLIDACSERLQQLAADHDPGRSLVCEAAVLAAEEGEPVTWNRYADARLDGVITAQGWQAFFPNLRAQGQETVRGQRLESLLQRWSAAGPGPRRFQLVLRQGDPLSAVAGLGARLPDLQRVELAGPKAEALWQEPLGAWLEARGFCRQSGPAAAWERDLLASCMQERDTLAERVKEYEDRLSQIAAELDQLLAWNDNTEA